MKILLVEDDAKTAAFIKKGLQETGYTVDHAADGEDGLFKAVNEPYDCAIVDIMLPKMNGLSLIAALRAQKITLPVIILSAKKTVDDRIRGLQSGSDDYLVKPFAFSELAARIQALLRRIHTVAEPTLLKVADLTLDIVRRKVSRAGHEIDLQQKEFSLLEYLMRNTGHVVSKTMIMEHVWDYNFDPKTNVVEVRMCRLREKIDGTGEHPLIHTIRGAGYVLEERL